MKGHGMQSGCDHKQDAEGNTFVLRMNNMNIGSGRVCRVSGDEIQDQVGLDHSTARLCWEGLCFIEFYVGPLGSSELSL
jgi:hypothetical protein